MSRHQSDPLLEAYEILPPISKRKPWTTSRLAVLPDGTTMPVLRLLAREKFGEWDEKLVMPFWKDKDWMNETLENVGLVEVSAGTTPHSRKSTLNIPSGTKAYYEEWRKRNPDKVQESQRRYRKKRQEAYRSLRHLEKTGQVSAAAPAEEEPAALRHLEEILKDERPT